MEVADMTYYANVYHWAGLDGDIIGFWWTTREEADKFAGKDRAYIIRCRQRPPRPFIDEERMLPGEYR
jgi:hypothetical protein